MTTHERELAIRRETGQDFNSLIELIGRIDTLQDETPSFFHSSNTDLDQFKIGIMLFDNFMRIVDHRRRSQHNEPMGLLVPDFEPLDD